MPELIWLVPPILATVGAMIFIRVRHRHTYTSFPEVSQRQRAMEALKRQHDK